MRPVADIADLRDRARHRLPHPLFEFIDGGSYSEATLRANCAAWGAFYLRQQVLTGVATPALGTTIMGLPSRLPMMISPTGMSGTLWHRGEIAAARAAQAVGVPFCLAMMSSCTIEDVAQATTPPWLQMAPMSDRGVMQMLLDRGAAAGCPALVLTVTWPFPARHYRLTRNRFDNPAGPPSLSTAAAFMARPGWLYRVAIRGKIRMANFDGYMETFTSPLSVIEGVHAGATWDDVAWIRDAWPGKLMIKGILNSADAEKAVAVGADAISVSNHGGNQLDSAPPTAAVLPSIVRAVDGRIEVLVDGGIRTGHDVLKALGLGARACLLGRAHLFGLAAMGEAGVAKVLTILAEELSTAMRLTGTQDVQRVSSDVLWKDEAVERTYANGTNICKCGAGSSDARHLDAADRGTVSAALKEK